MEKLRILLSFGAPMLGLLSTCIIIFKKYIKNNKLRKALVKSEEILNHLIPCVTEAENYIHFSGEEKKEYVMTKINQYAIDNNITFDERVISDKIEELINMSKKVNAHEIEANDISKTNMQNKTEDIVNAIQNIIDGLKA